MGLAIELACVGQWRAATEIAERVDFAGLPIMAAILSRAFAEHDPALARSLLVTADRHARAQTHSEFASDALEEVVRSSIAMRDWARARGRRRTSPTAATKASRCSSMDFWPRGARAR